MTAEELEEENEKFWRRMREMEEQYCMNRLGAKISCQGCKYVNTQKCVHPEQVFSGYRY